MPLLSRGPWRLGRAAAVVAGLSLAGAASGALVAVIWPAHFELAAFVEDGWVDGRPLVPRADLLEQLNGLGTATAAAGEVNESPWVFWRGFWVAGEGPLLAIRVRHRDRVRGAQILEAARTAITAELRRRHDRVMAPHAAYTEGLRTQIRQMQSLARGSAVSAERELATSTLRRSLRDAEMFAARSRTPAAIGEVRVREPDRTARALSLILSGAFVGFAVGIAAIARAVHRSRPERALAGV